jgi:hypothetical protein
MNENDLNQVTVIALFLNALVPLINVLFEIIKSIIDFIHKSQRSDIIKFVFDKFKQLILPVLLIIVTLILPDMFIVEFSMKMVQSYLRHRVANDREFVYQLVVAVSALAAIYPLVWGVYIYPFCQKSKLIKLINFIKEIRNA